jgi:UTP-glucose-1-phosphate uridylyltransferase
MNKIDGHLIMSLVLITINNINLNAIDYFVKNYELEENLKNKIRENLEKKIHY